MNVLRWFRRRRLRKLAPFERVVDAICANPRQLKLCYVNMKGERSERFVIPLTLLMLRSGDAGFGAYCTLRRDYRTFAFHRVQSLAEGDSGCSSAYYNADAYGWAHKVHKHGRGR